jgi:hypothetical protein
LLKEFWTCDEDHGGWPLVHTVVARVSAATGDPLASCCFDAPSDDEADDAAGLPVVRMSLGEVLQASTAEQLETKGPGGFTILHLACLGTLTDAHLG